MNADFIFGGFMAVGDCVHELWTKSIKKNGTNNISLVFVQFLRA